MIETTYHQLRVVTRAGKFYITCRILIEQETDYIYRSTQVFLLEATNSRWRPGENHTSRLHKSTNMFSAPPLQLIGPRIKQAVALVSDFSENTKPRRWGYTCLFTPKHRTQSTAHTGYTETRGGFRIFLIPSTMPGPQDIDTWQS